MDPFEQLLTSSPAQTVPPELLETIGHRSVRMFLDRGVPLNQAIVDMVAEHPELNNEHIKRVVEFANNSAFQELFQKSEDKNVHFDVADPGVVLRDTKDGGSPAHDGKVMSSDYHRSPQDVLEKTQFADPESGMEYLNSRGGVDGQFRQGEAIEKMAGMVDSAKRVALGIGAGTSIGAGLGALRAEPGHRMEGLRHGAGTGALIGGAVPIGAALASNVKVAHSDPTLDVHDLHTQLRAANTELTAAHEEFDLLVKQAKADLYAAVKHEVLDPDGAGLGGVISALEKTASKDMVFAILKPIVEKIAGEVRPEVLKGQLTKTASMLVNIEHPVIRTFAGLVKAAEEQVRTEVALCQVREGLKQTTTFLSELR